MYKSIAATLAPLTIAALVVGCGHDAPPAPKAPQAAVVAKPQPQLTSALVPAKQEGREVGVSDEILRACEIHIGNVADAPKFDFDRAELVPQDRDVLAQVATCVTSGPLKGRALQLVGRADPRGEQEYNFALGEHRASAVTRYLKGLGVDPSKLTETSRGKLDATGTDEAGWRLDRRVDIELAK